MAAWRECLRLSGVMGGWLELVGQSYAEVVHRIHLHWKTGGIEQELSNLGSWGWKLEF